MRTWLNVLLCAWVLWSSVLANGSRSTFAVGSHETQAACLDAAKEIRESGVLEDIEKKNHVRTTRLKCLPVGVTPEVQG